MSAIDPKARNGAARSGTDPRRILLNLAFAGYGLLLVYLFVTRGYRHFNRFPGSYSWTDILINYQGGIVRRGLLGEIAFRLNDIVPVSYFATFLTLAAYLLLAGWFLWRARARPGLATALFLVSPAALLFPIYDPEGFGRKDIFIICAFVGAAVSITRLPRNTSLAVILIVYLTMGFVAEISWLYFPLAISLLIAVHPTAPARWQIAVCGIAIAFMAAWFAATLMINTVADKQAMMISWQAIYPTAFRGEATEGAVKYLGVPARLSFMLTKYHLSDSVTRNGYLIAFALSAVPVVLFMAGMGRSRLPLLPRLCILGALAAMTITFVIAADWGRYTHLLLLHVFAFLMVLDSAQERRAADDPPVAWSATAMAMTALVVVLYATTWRLDHFAPAGGSALHTGLLFYALGRPW